MVLWMLILCTLNVQAMLRDQAAKKKEGGMRWEGKERKGTLTPALGPVLLAVLLL